MPPVISTTACNTAILWRYSPVSPSRGLPPRPMGPQAFTLPRNFLETPSTQITQPAHKMRVESQGNIESVTRRQLREKIATLPTSQLMCATGTFATIWRVYRWSGITPVSLLLSIQLTISLASAVFVTFVNSPPATREPPASIPSRHWGRGVTYPVGTL